jgi:hypothetical protein
VVVIGYLYALILIGLTISHYEKIGLVMEWVKKKKRTKKNDQVKVVT